MVIINQIKNQIKSEINQGIITIRGLCENDYPFSLTISLLWSLISIVCFVFFSIVTSMFRFTSMFGPSLMFFSIFLSIFIFISKDNIINDIKNVLQSTEKNLLKIQLEQLLKTDEKLQNQKTQLTQSIIKKRNNIEQRDRRIRAVIQKICNIDKKIGNIFRQKKSLQNESVINTIVKYYKSQKHILTPSFIYQNFTRFVNNIINKIANPVKNILPSIEQRSIALAEQKLKKEEKELVAQIEADTDDQNATQIHEQMYNISKKKFDISQQKQSLQEKSLMQIMKSCYMRFRNN